LTILLNFAYKLPFSNEKHPLLLRNFAFKHLRDKISPTFTIPPDGIYQSKLNYRQQYHTKMRIILIILKQDSFSKKEIDTSTVNQEINRDAP
jgi:hypothetical protein